MQPPSSVGTALKTVFSAFLNWAISIRDCEDVTWLKNIAWRALPDAAIMLTIHLKGAGGGAWAAVGPHPSPWVPGDAPAAPGSWSKGA